MPNRKEHNKIARDLRGKVFDKSVSDKKIDSINRWMDNPATKTGQFNLKKTKGPVTPNTHREIRHKPSNVARALSGNGKADREIDRIAKIHALTDKGYTKKEIRKTMLKRRNSKKN